jgi:hypothetical protein
VEKFTKYLVTALVVIVVLAIVWRIDALRKLVTGVTA